MPFSRPSLQQLKDRIVADFESLITNETGLLRRSVLRVLAYTWAGCCHLIYGYLSFVAEQVFAVTAEEPYLGRIADEEGVVPRDARQATGSVIVSGAYASVVPAGHEIYREEDGERYTFDSDVELGTPAASGTSFQGTGAVTAVVAGASGNEETGVELIFSTPIPGIDNAVEVGEDGLSGGADADASDTLRKRTLNRKRQVPVGGSRNDIEQWALEITGVTRAWCHDTYLGLPGRVAVAFMKDGEADEKNRLPTADDRQTMKDYLVQHTDPATGDTVGLPVTAKPGLSVVALSFLDLDPEIHIDPNTDVVKTAVAAELSDLLESEGGSGQTVTHEDLLEAIHAGGNSAVDRDTAFRSRLVSPARDVTALVTQVHRVGSITWGDY